MSTPETLFKDKLRKAFVSFYGDKSDKVLCGAVTASRGQPTGLPDRYFGADGSFFWLEAKVDGSSSLSVVQDLQLRRLANCGQNAYVAILHYPHLPRSLQVFSIIQYKKEGQIENVFRYKDLSLVKDKSFWERLLYVF